MEDIKLAYCEVDMILGQMEEKYANKVPSELRNSFYKYFLHDGTYEWTHTIALDASYIIKQSKIPLQIFGGIGYVYDFFTQSEKGANQKSPYHKINTVEYPTKHGCVMYFGLKLFAF